MPAQKPSPVRERLREYPTPLIADVILRESRETSRLLSPAGSTAADTIPALGSAHPNAAKYPNHKLVHVTVNDEEGLWFMFHYAAERLTQELYNYTLTYPYGGNPSYPRVTRTYVLARGQDPLPLGEEDPGDGFQEAIQVLRADGTVITRADGTTTLLRAGLSDPVLVAQSERPISGELGSVYVEVTRVYDVIPGADDGTGRAQNECGYKVTFPIGGHAFAHLEWTLTLPRTIADNSVPLGLDLVQCPITGYTNLQLVEETTAASPDNNQVSTVTRIYEGNLEDAPWPSTTFKLGTDRQLPGSMPPDKFITGVVTIEKEIPIATPLTETVTDSAPDGYTLIQVKITPESAVRGVKTLVYALASTTTLTGQQWDDNLETFVPYTVEVMAKATADALVPVAGTDLNVQPLNAYWSVVTRETPVISAITVYGTAETPLGTHSVGRYGTHPHSWPAVLDSASALYDFYINTSTGASEFYLDYQWLTPAWSGLCRARFQTAYSDTNPITAGGDLPIDYLEPSEMRVNWPITKFAIPSCLHPALGPITETSHGLSLGPKEWAASTLNGVAQIVWPASLCVSFDVKPYKNGFLVRRVDVYKPY